MIPWGTPEWMWKRLEVSSLNFVSNWRSFNIISAGSNSLRVRFFQFCIVALGAILQQMPGLRLKMRLYNTVGFP